MLKLAERLIALEAGAAGSAGAKAVPAAFPPLEKLRLPLAALMGNTGFRALLARSLALARGEIASLEAVQVNADGSLGGWTELRAKLAPGQFLECQVALLAQLLGLLAAFIGESLTLRTVREIWPKLPPPPHLDKNKRSKNEKA